MMRERHITGRADIADMCRIHCAGDGLHFGGVPQNPGDGNRSPGSIFLLCDVTERLVQLRKSGWPMNEPPNIPYCSGDQACTVMSCRRQ